MTISSVEHFACVRKVLERTAQLNTHGQLVPFVTEALASLDELESRTRASIVDRLVRVEEDLAAFRREHEGHRHVPVLGTLSSVVVDEAGAFSAITDMRNNAENRAWAVIEEWHKAQAGTRYYVIVCPPLAVTDRWNVSIVALGTDATKILKGGTSRLDAFAHLVAWCTEDMHAG